MSHVFVVQLLSFVDLDVVEFMLRPSSKVLSKAPSITRVASNEFCGAKKKHALLRSCTMVLCCCECNASLQVNRAMQESSFDKDLKKPSAASEKRAVYAAACFTRFIRARRQHDVDQRQNQEVGTAPSHVILQSAPVHRVGDWSVSSAGCTQAVG